MRSLVSRTPPSATFSCRSHLSSAFLSRTSAPSVTNVSDTPSPDLLDTIYICQQRQEWYRDFARSEGEEPVPYVGSAHLNNDVEAPAARIPGHSIARLSELLPHH